MKEDSDLPGFITGTLTTHGTQIFVTKSSEGNLKNLFNKVVKESKKKGLISSYKNKQT